MQMEMIVLILIYRAINSCIAQCDQTYSAVSCE